MAKAQWDGNYEKVVKGPDDFGQKEGFINYPSVAISTNKIESMKPDMSKRAVSFSITSKLDRETGAKSSKAINEGMRLASNALYCEYARRMMPLIKDMVEKMQADDKEYFPDIFEISSRTLIDLFREYSSLDNCGYAQILRYGDYFGERVVGKKAIESIKSAWASEREQFSVRKKKNTLTYTYPDNGRLFKLPRLKDELPVALNARIASKSLIMDLDEAKDVFGINFRKSIFPFKNK